MSNSSTASSAKSSGKDYKAMCQKMKKSLHQKEIEIKNLKETISELTKNCDDKVLTITKESEAKLKKLQEENKTIKDRMEAIQEELDDLTKKSEEVKFQTFAWDDYGKLKAEVEFLREQNKTKNKTNAKKSHGTTKHRDEHKDKMLLPCFEPDRCCARTEDGHQCNRKTHKDFGKFCKTHGDPDRHYKGTFASNICPETGEFIGAYGIFTEPRPLKWGEGKWKIPQEHQERAKKGLDICHKNIKDQDRYMKEYKEKVFANLPEDWVFNDGSTKEDHPEWAPEIEDDFEISDDEDNSEEDESPVVSSDDDMGNPVSEEGFSSEEEKMEAMAEYEEMKAEEEADELLSPRVAVEEEETEVIENPDHEQCPGCGETRGDCEEEDVAWDDKVGKCQPCSLDGK